MEFRELIARFAAKYGIEGLDGADAPSFGSCGFMQV